jgi:hypothetical protein
MTVAIRAEVITRGSGKNRAAWEKLCRRSPQSTVFHRPDFLDYHQDRFDERHLGFFRGSELVAVLPMAVRNDQGTSYGTSPYGGSYGGIAADDVLAYAEAFELVDAMIAAVREIGVGRLSIAPPVGRYCAAHSDTLEFCLLDQGFVRDNADVTCGTDLSRGPVAELILARARRHIRKAAKFDVQIVLHAPIEDFWPLLQMTMEKHGAAATHSLDQFSDLARRLPHDVWVDVAYVNGRPAAGIGHIKINPAVDSAFYICHDPDLQHTQALSGLMSFAMESAQREGCRWFDFGTSTVNMVPRPTNFLFKEGFGAVGLFRQRYSMEF